MAMSLEGKVAIITGASSGIGRAAAVVFAGERAKVVLAARRAGEGENVAKGIQASGGTAVFVRTDVSRAGEVKVLIEQTVSKYGRLDCAVNNAAATWNEQKCTADFSEEDFDREVNGNLKSVWLCLRSELEQMRRQERPGGTIVSVSSVNGLGAAPRSAFDDRRRGLDSVGALRLGKKFFLAKVANPLVCVYCSPHRCSNIFARSGWWNGKETPAGLSYEIDSLEPPA
jgi:NAD(P)-dependent dehydrogenase (short-subunit alcohol dehydrogenase family)